METAILAAAATMAMVGLTVAEEAADVAAEGST
jgi:hypothetical protein